MISVQRSYVSLVFEGAYTEMPNTSYLNISDDFNKTFEGILEYLSLRFDNIRVLIFFL